MIAVVASALSVLVFGAKPPGQVGDVVLMTGQGWPATHRVVVIGDSLTAGSVEGGTGPFGWPALVWNDLRSTGLDIAPEVSGRGGSGYVHRGLDGTVYADEAERLVWPDDAVVLFFGSRNDAPEPIDEIAAQAHRAFGNVRHTAGKATLMVIGPVWFAVHPSREIVAIRDVLREQTRLFGGIFVDPIEEGWFVGHPELIGADGRHPNNAGHLYLAERIAPHAREALAAMPRTPLTGGPPGPAGS